MNRPQLRSENPSREAAVIAEGTARQKTVATAESCTGGLIAHRLTNVPGSSVVFLHGWVTYSNESKTKELGVLPELIEKHGAVSEAVAAALATGALRESGVDLAVSVTGIAGPDGGTPEKPVGTVWFGLACKDGRPPQTRHELITGDRETFKQRAADVALELMLAALKQ